MLIHLVSDIHTDHHPHKINRQIIGESDLVIVAGDISVNGNAPESLLTTFGNVTNKLAFVLGNHDYWSNTLTMDEIEAKVRAASLSYGFKFLNNSCFIKKHIDKTYLIMGCTLWSDYYWRPFSKIEFAESELEQYLINNFSDFSFIHKNPAQKITLSDLITKYHKSLKEMDKMYTAMSNNVDEVLVITHMQPSIKSIEPQYINDIGSTHYFSDLEKWIINRPKITHWFAGHVHSSHDYKIGQCRVVVNPQGYASNNKIENTKFNRNLLIEV